jgi:hypothetical protein
MWGQTADFMVLTLAALWRQWRVFVSDFRLRDSSFFNRSCIFFRQIIVNKCVSHAALCTQSFRYRAISNLMNMGNTKKETTPAI